MVFKKFRLNLVLRVFLLTATILLFCVSISRYYVFTSFIAGFAVIYLVIGLIRYIDKTNRELTSFLESIRFNDFTRKFSMEGMGSSFESLNSAFNDVIPISDAFGLKKRSNTSTGRLYCRT